MLNVILTRGLSFIVMPVSCTFRTVPMPRAPVCIRFIAFFFLLPNTAYSRTRGQCSEPNPDRCRRKGGQRRRSDRRRQLGGGHGESVGAVVQRLVGVLGARLVA